MLLRGLGFVALVLLVNVVTGFTFLDVVPRSSGTSRELEPSLFCDKDSQDCILAYEVSDNGVQQIGLRKTNDRADSFGTQVLIGNDALRPQVACSGVFCVVIFTSVGNTIAQAVVSNNFGLTFSAPINIFQDATQVGRPSVSCFLENQVRRCLAGFETVSTNTFRVFRIDQGQNAFTFEQELAISGTALSIACRDEKFCVAAFGGGNIVRVVNKALGNNAQFSGEVEIEESVGLAALSGNSFTSFPELTIVDDNVVVLASNNRKDGVFSRVEIARSTDSGKTFSQFKTVFSRVDANADEASVSCFGEVCALAWEVDLTPEPPGFVFSLDGFQTFSAPQSFVNMISKNNGVNDMYDDPKVVCFETECVAVLEGENFLNGIPIDVESTVVTVLDLEDALEEKAAQEADLEREKVILGVTVGVSSAFGLMLITAVTLVLTRKGKRSRNVRPSRSNGNEGGGGGFAGPPPGGKFFGTLPRPMQRLTARFFGSPETSFGLPVIKTDPYNPNLGPSTDYFQKPSTKNFSVGLSFPFKPISRLTGKFSSPPPSQEQMPPPVNNNNNNNNNRPQSPPNSNSMMNFGQQQNFGGPEAASLPPRPKNSPNTFSMGMSFPFKPIGRITGRFTGGDSSANNSRMASQAPSQAPSMFKRFTTRFLGGPPPPAARGPQSPEPFTGPPPSVGPFTDDGGSQFGGASQFGDGLSMYGGIPPPPNNNMQRQQPNFYGDMPNFGGFQ